MTDVMIAVEKLMRHQLILRGARSSFVGDTRASVHVFSIRGKGRLPPLVLVHGFSAAAATQYSALIHRLRPYFSRIVAPDLPGHGMSRLPQQGLSSPVMIRALREALDSALEEPAIIFASSLGGGVATRFAAQNPHQVHKLILCSPGGAPIPKQEMATFLQRFNIRSHREALQFVDQLFVQPNPLRHVLAFGIRRQFSRPHMVELLRGVREEDFLTPQELQSLSMPVLLLWGKGERILPDHNLRFFRENLPSHARIEEPASFGHAPFFDQGAAVAEHILDFARDHHGTPIRKEPPPGVQSLETP